MCAHLHDSIRSNNSLCLHADVIDARYISVCVELDMSGRLILCLFTTFPDLFCVLQVRFQLIRHARN